MFVGYINSAPALQRSHLHIWCIVPTLPGYIPLEVSIVTYLTKIFYVSYFFAKLTLTFNLSLTGQESLVLMNSRRSGTI